MEHIIITEEAAYFRACARQTLAGKWTKPVLAVLIVDVFMQIPTMFLDSFFSVRVRSLNVMLKNAGMYEDIMAFSPAGAILEIFIAGAFAFGLTAFFIAFFRRQDADTTLVFSGFGRFINTLVLFLLYAFIVVAGMILFIVPGVIFFYRYSQAFCIMCDDPKKSPIQCMAESAFLMRGNKVKLFIMHLSFAGWAILAVIPGAMTSEVLAKMGFYSGTGMIGFIYKIIIFTASSGMFWVGAYINTAQIAFYDMLTGRFKKIRFHY